MPTHENYQTTKGSGFITSHPGSSQGMEPNLFGPLKEIYGYKYIFTPVDYTSMFVKAEPSDEKIGRQ